jgi:hypothetical protein
LTRTFGASRRSFVIRFQEHETMESNTRKVIVVMHIIFDVILAASLDSNQSSSMMTTSMTSPLSSVVYNSAPATASAPSQQMTSVSRLMTTDQAVMSTSSPHVSTATVQTTSAQPTLTANVTNDKTARHIDGVSATGKCTVLFQL